MEDARRYSIVITSVATGEIVDERSEIARTEYSLSGLEEGDYEIRVMATGGRQNTLSSEWSEIYSFHKDYETGCLYRLINNNTEYEIYGVGTGLRNRRYRRCLSQANL